MDREQEGEVEEDGRGKVAILSSPIADFLNFPDTCSTPIKLYNLPTREEMERLKLRVEKLEKGWSWLLKEEEEKNGPK